MTQRRPTTGRRGRKTPPDQALFIEYWCHEGWSNNDIIFILVERFGDLAIADRTVRNMTQAIRENKVPWNRLSTPSSDARRIVKVLAEVTLRSKGKKNDFTQEEADWVAYVSEIAPTLPLYGVWMVAILYMSESRQAVSFANHIDIFLALEPWESLEKANSYIDMMEDLDMDFTGERDGTAWFTLIDYASRIRAIKTREDNDVALREVKQMAEAGNLDAIFAMSLLEHEGVGDNFVKERKKAEAEAEKLRNSPTYSWPTEEERLRYEAELAEDWLVAEEEITGGNANQNT